VFWNFQYLLFVTKTIYITCKAFCRWITNFRSIFPMYFFGGKSKLIFDDILYNIFWSLTKSLYRLNIFQEWSWTPVRVTSMTYSFNKKHTTQNINFILYFVVGYLKSVIILKHRISTGVPWIENRAFQWMCIVDFVLQSCTVLEYRHSHLNLTPPQIDLKRRTTIMLFDHYNENDKCLECYIIPVVEHNQNNSETCKLCDAQYSRLVLMAMNWSWNPKWCVF